VMKKSLVLALAAAACVLGASPARAGDVSWSIGINAPLGYGNVGTVISNGPVYQPVYQPIYQPIYQPVYQPVVQAPPVVYVPAPAYYPPPQVVYRSTPRWAYGPAPVVVSRPVPIVYGGWEPQGHRRHGDRDRDHDGVPNRHDRYDERPNWDRDGDGIPNRYERRDDRRDDRKYRH
jgi:hypothetical protein